MKKPEIDFVVSGLSRPLRCYLDYLRTQLRVSDRPLEAATRLLGMFVKTPRLFGVKVPRAAHAWLRKADGHRPYRLALDLLRGEAKLNWLTIVTHHFMSEAELRAPLGHDRVASCAFVVPVDGQLVSMCEVNATGIREQLYSRLRAQTSRTRRSL